MNAIRKKDGFFIGLSEYVYDRDGNEYTWDEIDLVLNGKLQSQVEDEHRTELRERYAGMAMQAIISNQELLEECTNFIETDGKRGFFDYGGMKNGGDKVAKLAVAYADAMVDKLRRNKEE